MSQTFDTDNVPTPSRTRWQPFRDTGTGYLLRAATASALVVDAVVHLHDASFYDANTSSVLSQGDLFRAEGAAALLVAALLVVWPARIIWFTALIVTATAATAVILYTYVNVGAIGPLPNMYEPTWALPGKPTSVIAEIAGTALAAAGLLDTWQRRHAS